VNVPEAFDSVIPSQLVTRMKELVEQSRRYQEKLQEINREMVRINEHIAKLKPEAPQEEE
jgi:hypothetical protein